MGCYGWIVIVILSPIKDPRHELRTILDDLDRNHRPHHPLQHHRQLLRAQARTHTHTQIHVLHETGIGILIGFVFGLLMYLLGDITKIDFDEELFFYALLPPMIFAGGYNLKKKDFGKNFKYILIYGLVGTIVSFGVIFGLTFAISKLRWIIPLRTESHIE
jgi:NhaP-type Na+/H+ or K+/H+ antiporter